MLPGSGDIHLTGRSETTVKTHLGNLFAKIGAVSRLQAALWHREHRVQ